MKRNPLKQKLAEMQGYKKPPFLYTIGKTFGAPAKDVERVAQSPGIYESLDAEVADYKRFMSESEKSWLGVTFDLAREGHRWDSISGSIALSKRMGHEMSDDFMQRLKSVYSRGIKDNGPERVMDHINKAYSFAGNGLWRNVEDEVRKGALHAKEAGIELNVDMQDLKKTYMISQYEPCSFTLR